MAILIIDDVPVTRKIIESFLKDGGHTDIIQAESAENAFHILGLYAESDGSRQPIDLILMDIVLQGVDGIEACRLIKNDQRSAHIPIVIITAYTSAEHIETAFKAGAIDFLPKPINKLELHARVRSILHFKSEVDRLREREKHLVETTLQLERANVLLERLSNSDGLTGIPNRRYFDYMFKKLLASGTRLAIPISLLLMDIDNFKLYNDTYGHLAGDDCLKLISGAIHDTIKRESDFIARYGGEEFVIVLFGVEPKTAAELAENIREHIFGLKIPHSASSVSDWVTVSIGVVSCIPEPSVSPEKMIDRADKALYAAKSHGKNQVVQFEYAGV
ncbi:MAG: diguanylate cyclase [Desulfobacteraceae bacterium]|nr:diguanylate cyclase [Desulfobacteraceae bacterium]